MIKKRFSVVFLMFIIVLLLFCVFTACENSGQSPISQIVITTQPKLTYYWGDSFDTNGAVITVIYEDGTTVSKDLDIVMVSGFDANSLGEQVLTIREGEASTYLTVNVITPPVYSLEINSTEHKTEYVVGEKFNPSDLTVLVTFSNGKATTIPVTEEMVSGFDSESAGTKQIVIFYGNRTCNMTVQISNKTISEMQLTPPAKLSYIVGDTIDFTGGNIFVSYNDNSTERLDLNDLLQNRQISVVVSDEVSTTLTKSQRICTVKVYYRGREFPFAINVEDLKAMSLAVTTDFGNQIMGSPDFDFSKGVISVTYNNKTSDNNLSFYDSKVSLDLTGCDISAVGNYTMAITVAGATCEYPIKVVSPSPDALEVYPDRNEIYQNDPIDITNWTYRIKLNNGNYQRIGGETIFHVTEDMFFGNVDTDIDNFKVGDHEYVFEILDSNGVKRTDKVNITVLKKEITSLEIINEGRNVYSEGDVFSLDKTYLTATYNDGTRGNKLAVSYGMLRADALGSEFDQDVFLTVNSATNKVEKTVYVYYTDTLYESSASSYYSVTVVSKALSIAFLSGAELPNDSYVLGDDFDCSDWQLLITYANNTTSTCSGENGGLNDNEWNFVFTYGGEEVDSFDKTGNYTVHLYYGGSKSVGLSYNVSVTNNIRELYINKAHLGFVTEGTEPDLTGTEITIVRENGEKEVVSLTEEMIGGYTAAAYKSTQSGFISAYVDANVIAALDNVNGVWSREYEKYYVLSGDDYVRAGSVYSVENDYKINVAYLYEDNWDDLRFNFFEGDNKSRVNGDYDSEKEYYINNTVKISATIEDKSVDVLVTSTAKKITGITLSEYKSNYIKTETEWDIEALKLIVSYNNGTASVISGTESSNNLLLSTSGSGFAYILNGLNYSLEIVKAEQDSYIIRSFEDFINYFENVMLSGTDLFYEEELNLRILDAVTGEYVYSSAFEVACFNELVEEIKIFVGRYDGTDFVPYENQTVYLNEGLDLLQKAFVINDSYQRKCAADDELDVYIYVKTDSDEKYYKLTDAPNVSSSFEMPVYSDTTVYQTLTLGFLGKTATMALEIRPNIMVDLKVTVPDGGLTVIENMAVNSNDVGVFIQYVDADYKDENGVVYGDPECVPWEKKVDFRLTACTGYSKTDVWTFAENENYKTVDDYTIAYRGFSKTISLTVKPKTLTEIRITSLPEKIQYVERTDTTLIFDGGTVSLIFDNGTSQSLPLSSGNIIRNTGEFTAAVASGEELTGGEQRSYTIFVSYTYRRVMKSTSYNVIIVDRKDVTIKYDSSLGVERKLICEYGSNKNVLPNPVINYYERYTDIAPTPLEQGNKNTVGYYYVEYRDANGNVSSEWPTQVGRYTVIYSYFYDGEGINGDAYNNAFYDETVVIEIIKKKLGIRIDPIEISFGTVLEGDNGSAFVNLTYNSKKYWTMTGIENGIANGEPYFYDDDDNTVISSINLFVYENDDGVLTLKNFPVFTDGNTLLKYSSIIIPVGSYVIKPVVEVFEDANYEIDYSVVNNTYSTLTVLKRKILLVAEKAEKVYGEGDPDYKFRVYDFDDAEGKFGESLSEKTAQQIFDAEGNDFKPIGNKTGIYYLTQGTAYLGNGQFGTSDYLIYRDRNASEYNLTRDVSDSENVNDVHVIPEGDPAILSNYDIVYVSNILQINKAGLVVTGDNLIKYFGTQSFHSGSLTTKFAIHAKAPYVAVGGDDFDSLFENYFSEGTGVLYFNASRNEYTNQLSSYGDDWYVLYKNIKIYTDPSCDQEFIYGEYRLFEFSIAGKNYSGYYTALPLAAPVGDYYVELLLDNINYAVNSGLNNYSVRAEESAYAFKLTIAETRVIVNSKSFIVTGNGTLKDQKNSQSGRNLQSYFLKEGLDIQFIDRTTYDAELDEIFKREAILSYVDENGKGLVYLLSDDILLSEFEFIREDYDSALNTGIHSVTTNGLNTQMDFDIMLESKVSGVPYVQYFYNIWNNFFDLANLTGDYSENAYILVLPEYVDIIPNQEDVEYVNGVPTYNYNYTRKRYGNIVLNSYISLDGNSYNDLYDMTGITYELRDSITNMILDNNDILNVGTYNGVITYSFFDTSTKNYLYLGDTLVSDSSYITYILNYLFDNTYYVSDGDKPLTFTAGFVYNITKAQISLSIESNTVDFDNTAKTIGVNITSGRVYSGDTLPLTFDFSVIYNEERQSTEYSDTAISLYRLGDNVVEEISAMPILNAGVYTFTSIKPGDRNYEIDNIIPGTYTISPISVPVYIQTNGANGLVMTSDYKASESGINPIDSIWKEASNPNDFYMYKTNGTTPCYIVKDYYVNNRFFHTNANFVPSNLIVSTAQPDGSYPRNVRRDDETGEVIGYPISYMITNTTFKNYSIIFVKDDGGTFVKLDDGEQYELIIKPKTVMLYGFNRINYKEYDSNPAYVRGTDIALTLIGDYKSDPIVRSGISFVFTRPESSMKIGDYIYIVDEPDGIKASENITDAGVLHVKAIYSDAYGNKNYDIRFADTEICYTENNIVHNDIALYTILQSNITLDLKHCNSDWLNRQYDGYGLLNPLNDGFTGDSTDLFMYNDPVDSKSEIYYKLNIKRYGSYGANPGSSQAVSPGAEIHLTDYGGTPYNVGYYWYDLRGVFYIEETDTYHTFEEFSPSASNWISWNYTFDIKSPEGSSVDYYNCDGIYVISPRDVYIVFNSKDYSGGLLNTSADEENNPTAYASDYNYKITYSGYSYQHNGSGSNTVDFINKLTDLNDDSFKFALYAYNRNTYEFTNVLSIVNLSTYYTQKINSINGNIFSSVSGNAITTRNDAGITVEIGNLINAVSNFNIVNKNIVFSIRPFEIDLKLSLVRISDHTLNEMIYGTNFDTYDNGNDGLYFKFDFNGEYSFNGNDTNLTDLNSIITEIINKSSGYLELLDVKEKNKDPVSRFLIYISSIRNNANAWYSVTENGKTYYYVKVSDSLIQSGQSLPSKLQANSYDDYNNPIERYITSGDGLSSNAAKYSVNVTGTNFVVSRRKVTVEGVERIYFDKETDNYVFTFLDVDSDEGNRAISTYSGIGHNMKDYIEDNTSIEANVGTWALDNKDYYVRIIASEFVINDSNYIVNIDDTNRIINVANVNQWNDKKPVYIGSYIYIPLTINKTTVTVHYSVTIPVYYGDIITTDLNAETQDGEIIYQNLPALNSQGIYYYYNHANGETMYDDNVFYTGKYNNDQPISLQQEQNSFKNSIINAILFDSIKTTIATSDVDESQYVLLMSDFISSTPVADNYLIAWGNLTYTVVKKKIKMEMEVKEQGNYSLNSAYFSALWSEKDDLYYSNGIYEDGENPRLAYGVKIDTFTLNGVNYNNLNNQISAIINAQYNQSTGKFIYGDIEYNNTVELMRAICNYEIYLYASVNNTIVASSGGDIRYIALCGIESKNFEITYTRKGIMLYPEVIGLGSYTDEFGDYINLIPSTEAPKTGVLINTNTNAITGLSLLFRLNFAGFSSDMAIQYSDTNKNDDYNQMYYIGMGYDRTVRLVYIPDCSGTLINAENPSLKNDDVITVKLIVEESFYYGAIIRTFESPYFEIVIKEEGNSSGYKITKADKSNSVLYSETSLESQGIEDFDKYLTQQSAKYYLSRYVTENNTTTRVEVTEMVDIVNMRVRLLQENTNTKKFEIIVYENSFGTLLLGFDGKMAYTRMIYNDYYILAYNNYSAADNKYYGGANNNFYRFILYEPPEQLGGEPEPIPSGTYYEKVGNGFMLTSDTVFGLGKLYYTIDSGNNVPTSESDYKNLYVNYSECRISEELVSLFDGVSHSFSIYIDKVGALTNIKRQTSKVETAYPGTDDVSTMYTDVYTADRLLTLRVSIDNVTYLFSYIGEPFAYSYKKHHFDYGEEREAEEIDYDEINYDFYNSRMFLEKGKSAIRFENLKVLVNKFSVQNRLIAAANYQGRRFISNVLFWPNGETDEDTVYVTNEKSTNTIFEIMSQIGNVTISGGENAYAPYAVTFNDENKVVSVYSETKNILNQNAIISLDPGMYTVEYTSSYNYSVSNNDFAWTLGTNQIKILVTNNSSDELVLYDRSDQNNILTYNINSSSPVTFGNGTYLTSDITNNMKGKNALTYIFDNVNMNDKTGDIYIYFKLSNMAFTDLTKNDDLTSAVGIALRLSRRQEDALTYVTRANIIASQQVPLDEGSRFSTWKGDTVPVEMYDSSDVINIVKMDVARKTNEKTGHALGDDSTYDTVVSIRLYQHHTTTNKTVLVFEDYVRVGFGNYEGEVAGSAITHEQIEKNFFAAGTAHYAGVRLDDSSLRLIDFYYGIPMETSLDFAKYDISSSTDIGNEGEYYNGDKIINGTGELTIRMTDGGVVYMASDKYNVPYTYTGNAVNFRFKLNGTGGFRYYFALNTPYVLNIRGTSESSRRQRGLIFQYNATTGEIIFYYFKYNSIGQAQYVLSGNEMVTFNDGEEHSVTIFFDTDSDDAIQTISSGNNDNDEFQNVTEGFPTERYLAKIIIDEKYLYQSRMVVRSDFVEQIDFDDPAAKEYMAYFRKWLEKNYNDPDANPIAFNEFALMTYEQREDAYDDLFELGDELVSFDTAIQNETRWCSELYERNISGYNGTRVNVKYDDCNPFGMIAGDFGEIASLSKHATKSASNSTIVAFNSLSELFAAFMGYFEIPTDGTEYIPSIGSDALDAYTLFYNAAIELYNGSLVSFTKNINSDLTRSAVIGVNHPYTMTFGTDVSPELINFQTVIANLFGFSSKTEFMNYAQNLANTYAQHRTNITNSTATNEALENGCFYTSNGSFVFPIAVKNELSSTVLAYVILDTSGLVSVWVNDITAALWATNFNVSYHTDSIINNELYCKNILFVTGPSFEEARDLAELYKYEVIDRTPENYQASEVFFPISNNFNGLNDTSLSDIVDNENDYMDYLFLKGIYYMGFEVFADTTLEVLDCIAFEQYDIFD